jgi:hypothetical protein
MWRMGGAPQNSRQKNVNIMAHRPMRHKNYQLSMVHQAVVRHRFF